MRRRRSIRILREAVVVPLWKLLILNVFAALGIQSVLRWLT